MGGRRSSASAARHGHGGPAAHRDVFCKPSDKLSTVTIPHRLQRMSAFAGIVTNPLGYAWREPLWGLQMHHNDGRAWRACAVVISAVALFYSSVAAAETQVERGKYLMDAIVGCDDCHTIPGPPGKGMTFAGGFVFVSPAFHAVSPNITQDRETGIGAWTDEQIIDAIRNGRRPDNTVIGPPMPIDMYNRMSDDDVKAIVAYLRTIKPIKHKVAKSNYKMPLHAPPPAGHVTAPPKSDKVAYGAYISGPLAHCIECHTPQVRGQRDFEHMLGAGGFPFDQPGGGVILAPNITPDPETGIGKWTDDQIKKVITTGIHITGRKMGVPMPFDHFAKMTAEDFDAVVTYLHSMKPIKHKVQ
jgi:mono/diheme cytochrome c family protein